ncbi:MAG: molecular chaperone HtpG [Solirubrobacterales bacterium]
MDRENGNISIHTENILPIIKQWLYSDKDIFIRELVSNGCDAASKLKRLVDLGEAKPVDEKYEIKVLFNKEEKTLKFIDNGIGMTGDEVKKYINQVAFSGAEDFIIKYKDKMDEANQIIGHFGLGFYSAFMVSEKVEINTLSYMDGSTAVKWVCHGGTEYEITESDRKNRGTTVTLYLNEDCLEFLDEFKLREVIKKHCGFLPVEIYLEDEKAEDKETEKKPLNDINPLWNKNPSECTEEEYKEFYRKLFNDYKEPLFWIHLNVDYPFNLKGILYFPKFDHEFNAAEGEVKLYNNQVFVADNIKEVIPEFLLLLKGAVDCRDLPLNVSRSFLQNDKNVIKISKHISKKVADKLTDLYKKERDKYNSFWDDINVFIKYGCIRENDFYEKVKDIIIFKSINGDYINLKEYLERNKDKHENKVFYVDDEKQQAQYIRMFKNNNLEALVLNTGIDSHFISFLEMKETGVKFTRVDSDLSETLKEDADASEEDIKKLEEIFNTALEDKKLELKVENLKDEEIPAILLLSEEARRMQNMKHMFQGMDMGDMFKDEETLVINNKNNLVKSILGKSSDESKTQDIKLICRHIYDLAVISSRQMEAEDMAKFILRSNEIMKLVID